MGKQPQKKKDTKMINGIEGFFYLTERVLLCPFPGATAKSPRGSDDVGETP